MAGFLLGAVFGCAALWCLAKVTAAITSGKPEKAALPLAGNILSIGVGLALAALFFRERLYLAGIGLAGVLIGGAMGLFIYKSFVKK